MHAYSIRGPIETNRERSELKICSCFRRLEGYKYVLIYKGKRGYMVRFLTKKIAEGGDRETGYTGYT